MGEAADIGGYVNEQVYVAVRIGLSAIRDYFALPTAGGAGITAAST
jgi:hypothetical protein